jgi:hypothetical protein
MSNPEDRDNRPTVGDLIEAMRPLVKVFVQAVKATRLDLALVLTLVMLLGACA